MKTPNYFVDRTRNSQLRKKSAAMHHGIVTIPPLAITVGTHVKRESKEVTVLGRRAVFVIKRWVLECPKQEKLALLKRSY